MYLRGFTNCRKPFFHGTTPQKKGEPTGENKLRTTTPVDGLGTTATSTVRLQTTRFHIGVTPRFRQLHADEKKLRLGKNIQQKNSTQTGYHSFSACLREETPPVSVHIEKVTVGGPKREKATGTCGTTFWACWSMTTLVRVLQATFELFAFPGFDCSSDPTVRHVLLHAREFKKRAFKITTPVLRAKLRRMIQG
ncbi:hypothetical protein RUM43_000463 [Polyplax serrata]|uniref:Uncharacterized protein n=1 Tax=Polyplax serrata TaxID=468196 RepID=A0AAN8SE14_POLSC